MEINKTYDQLYKVIDDMLFDFVTYRRKKNQENEMKNFYEIEKKYEDFSFKDYKEEDNLEDLYNKEAYIEKNCNKENKYSDIDYMENILTELNRKIYPHTVFIIDQHEYEGSPIYDNILDKEFIAQLVDKVLDRLIKEIDEVEEITVEITKGNLPRLKLLRGVIELTIMCEVFSFRRPHYRKYNILKID